MPGRGQSRRRSTERESTPRITERRRESSTGVIAIGWPTPRAPLRHIYYLSRVSTHPVLDRAPIVALLSGDSAEGTSRGSASAALSSPLLSSLAKSTIFAQEPKVIGSGSFCSCSSRGRAPGAPRLDLSCTRTLAVDLRPTRLLVIHIFFYFC